MKKFLIIISILSISLISIVGCNSKNTTMSRQKNNISHGYININTCYAEETNDDALNETDVTIPAQDDNANEENTNQDATQNGNSNNKLYDLTNDIMVETKTYGDLIEYITTAITETENLISDITDNKTKLTNEQKAFINQEIQNLKVLTRRLNMASTKLQILASGIDFDGHDINNLTNQYLLILDNLVNNNEMLEAGINSLNLVKYLFNANLPDGTHGRLAYRYRDNINPPISKDYYFNDDGTITENNETVDSNNTETTMSSFLKPNIDTYYNNNLENNVDTFFNTALLDNQFMYGRNNIGMNQYMNYPYSNQGYRMSNTNSNELHNNTVNRDIDTDNTPNIETKREKRKLLKKNIDTYKDDSTPGPIKRISSFKERVSQVFNPRAEYPVYNFEENSNN